VKEEDKIRTVILKHDWHEHFGLCQSIFYAIIAYSKCPVIDMLFGCSDSLIIKPDSEKDWNMLFCHADLAAVLFCYTG
jgi:hypothetical protein